MNKVVLDIAGVLAEKAKAKTRMTYEQLGAEIGWSHPTGRGLGRHLYELMHYCKEQGLPPLTLIVVRKGERKPAPQAWPHIFSALGNIDFEAKQDEVFKFDWTNVREFGGANRTPDQRRIWLTSFWGFEPETWGALGFSASATRNYFVKRTKPGVIVVIYVTKGRGPENERGKVVGFLEVSHTQGNLREFISGDQRAQVDNDPSARGKWLFALKVTRAWRIAPEEQVAVDQILPLTYASSSAEFIGSHGVPVDAGEIEKLKSLTVYEVPVYGEPQLVSSAIEPFRNALKPSQAVQPSKEPYWVGETDGPKHLYILQLTGDIVHYLGRSAEEVAEKWIVKVG